MPAHAPIQADQQRVRPSSRRRHQWRIGPILEKVKRSQSDLRLYRRHPRSTPGAGSLRSAQPERRVIRHIGQRQQPVAEGQRLQFRSRHVGQHQAGFDRKAQAPEERWLAQRQTTRSTTLAQGGERRLRQPRAQPLVVGGLARRRAGRVRTSRANRPTASPARRPDGRRHSHRGRPPATTPMRRPDASWQSPGARHAGCARRA